VGWLRISATEAGVSGIEFLDQPPTGAPMIQSPHLKEAYKQLSEYFRGERMTFKLKLDFHGTKFQKDVWKALESIPFGSTASYKEIAESIGCPKGARAIGMANNRNPLPIVVPCHRVIGASGDMVGYGSGLELKEKLLRHEGILSS
jgi:O-6-methylguanine DNA methyltransferase